MLTAKSEEDNIIKGFASGADDYLTKPFSPRELVARIKAILRRKAPELIDEPIKINDLHLDPSTHQIKSNHNLIRMGPTEFKLLHFFMKNPDRAYNRGQLIDQVWGDMVYIEERTVDVHILRLRKVLELSGNSSLIETVRGVGYRFAKR